MTTLRKPCGQTTTGQARSRESCVQNGQFNPQNMAGGDGASLFPQAAADFADAVNRVRAIP